jgi:CDP-4-dehydro-6-deoxyglucose reductase
MSFTITLEPSSKRFSAEANETILEAAFRSGINLNYSCSNGSCGVCIAELLDGTVDTKITDFHCKLTAEGNTQILLCSSRATSDCVIYALQADNIYDLPYQTIDTKVYKLESLTNDMMLLQLKTPRSKTLQFLAGQYVTLEIEGLNPRSKSIASCPCNGMYLHFHIHRSEKKDIFSDYLFNEMKPKQNVTVSGPNGLFTLDDPSKRPVIFVASNTGFAPIKSLIEHAIDLELSQEMYLYWVMPEGSAHYLENYCHSWVDAFDNFHYVSLHSPAELNFPQQLNFVAKQISRQHSDVSGFDFYLNGPKEHTEGFIEHLQPLGLDRERLFIDDLKRF